MRSPRIALLLCGLAVLVASVAAACERTSGRQVRVAFRFVAVPEGSAPLGDFDTETGFHVVLTEARIALGPVYALRGDEMAGRARAFRGLLASLVLPSVARAHGGVDPLTGRAILAQALDQLAFDALEPAPIDTDPVIATHGVAQTLTIALEPPSTANAAALHAHHVYVEGVATKDATTIPFAGGIDLPDSGTTRRVENVALGATLDEGSVITLAVHPARWLRGAFFDRLGPADERGVHPIVAGDQVAGALGIGVRSQASYEAFPTQETP